MVCYFCDYIICNNCCPRAPRKSRAIQPKPGPMLEHPTKWMSRHEMNWIHLPPNKETPKFKCSCCNIEKLYINGCLRCDPIDQNICYSCYQLTQTLPMKGKHCSKATSSKFGATNSNQRLRFNATTSMEKVSTPDAISVQWELTTLTRLLLLPRVR